MKSTLDSDGVQLVITPEIGLIQSFRKHGLSIIILSEVVIFQNPRLTRILYVIDLPMQML